MNSFQISNVENLSPIILKRIAKEMHELQNEPPEGIRVQLNGADISDIQAYIDGPAGTPYAQGVFRVKLCLGKDFPTTPPKGYFLTKIFHPNVAANGEICVNTLKKDWKCDLGIKHVLLVIKCLLIVPNAESALNEEAGKLLLEDYDQYYKRAEMMCELYALRTYKENKENGSLEKKCAAKKSSVNLDRAKPKDKKRTLKRL